MMKGAGQHFGQSANGGRDCFVGFNPQWDEQKALSVWPAACPAPSWALWGPGAISMAPRQGVLLHSRARKRGTLGGVRSAAAARRGGRELSLSQDRRTGRGAVPGRGHSPQGPGGGGGLGVEPTGACPQAWECRAPSQPPGQPGASTRCSLREHPMSRPGTAGRRPSLPVSGPQPLTPAGGQPGAQTGGRPASTREPGSCQVHTVRRAHSF